MMQPRPYQLDAIESLRVNIRKGIRRQILLSPTGTGKTLTSAVMIKGAADKGKRVLFVAHRLELIDQSVKTLQSIGLDVGVIRGNDRRRKRAAPVQVASIATLVRRIRPDADLVFIDEAHRALAKSYVAGVLEAYPKAVHIGLTATPCRSDGRPLGTMYNAIVQAITYERAIAEGYLAAPIVYSTPAPPDLSDVHTTGGDYDAGELAEAMTKGALIGNIVEHWQKYADGRRTVVFAAGVEHSTTIVARFVAAGVRAEHLDGNTPEEQRRAILERLSSGETQVVSNVGVLCEGWDLPACKCLVLARPTKSLSLYMQMAGRIFRPWNDVTPIILDHASNVTKHGLPHMDRPWSLEERIKNSKSDAPTKECSNCFARIAASARTCPHCDVDQKREDDGDGPRKLEEKDGELVEVKPPTEAEREEWLERAIAKANRRGLKPGWVWHAYEEKFHLRMPNDLWKRVKQSVAKSEAAA
ncbi:MAG TPA: DEAD/DEAH box helicase [Polyangiaceae bacterium]|jgi:superfamily II DNA or RNA helicase